MWKVNLSLPPTRPPPAPCDPEQEKVGLEIEWIIQLRFAEVHPRARGNGDTEYFSSQMSCQKPKNPAADVLNKKSEEEHVDHLAGSIWYAK